MQNYLTIIMPNYNSYTTLPSTIQSIQKQTFKNWKLIIVDDNSNAKTKKILKSYKNNKKIKIYYLKKNRGAGYCRNFALNKTKSDYLAFIDSDDTWKKNKLKEQLQFMIKNNYFFSYTYYNVINKNIKKKIFTPKIFNYNSFLQNTSIATSCMIVKNFKSKKIKFLETSSCDDYYFKCALLKKYKNAYCYPKFLTDYKIRSNSVQSNRYRNIFWVWKINKIYNKLNFIQNFLSIINISFNSLKKYGLR